ncbi:response regulator [Azospirillum sp. ST 5-10]|uniref:response regulator n=1 Tax=unclassified Azospirillum TaxID=2630922 RepID=UPI003F4A1E3E
MPARPIVVIDASPTQSLMYRLRFEEKGLEVVSAESLAEALPTLRRTAPAAAVVNLRTVVCDGDAAVAGLRAEIPDLPVVLVGEEESGAAPPGVHRVAAPDADLVVAEIVRIVGRPAGGAPAAPQAAASSPAASSPAAVGRPADESVFRRGHVLVVDDSVTYREFLRLELEDAGCHVVAAGGAPEAYAALERDDFDVVIVDLVMPGVSGTELCEAFDRFRRERRRMFDILVHTSQDRAELLVSCLRDGADEFVGKSQPLDVLKARLLSLLRRKFFIEDTFLV